MPHPIHIHPPLQETHPASQSRDASIGLKSHILHFAARYAAPPPTLDRCCNTQVPPTPNYYYLQVLVQYWVFNLSQINKISWLFRLFPLFTRITPPARGYQFLLSLTRLRASASPHLPIGPPSKYKYLLTRSRRYIRDAPARGKHKFSQISSIDIKYLFKCS